MSALSTRNLSFSPELIIRYERYATKKLRFGYTEANFVALLEELAKEDQNAENDDRADLLPLHFQKISEHPAGSDLIYDPRARRG